MSALIAAALAASTLIAPATAADTIAGCEFPIIVTRSATPTSDPISGGTVALESVGPGDLLCATGPAHLPDGVDSSLYAGQEAYELVDPAGFWLRTSDASALDGPIPDRMDYSLEREVSTGGWLGGSSVDLLATPGGALVRTLEAGADVLVHEDFEIDLDGTAWVPAQAVETGDEGWLPSEDLAERSVDDPEPTETETAPEEPAETATPAATGAPTADAEFNAAQAFTIGGVGLGVLVLGLLALRLRRAPKDEGVL
ncbi:hypothetical protein [Microbacterium sp. NPDC055683]